MPHNTGYQKGEKKVTHNSIVIGRASIPGRGSPGLPRVGATGIPAQDQLNILHVN
jgi:hypothetical protein